MYSWSFGDAAGGTASTANPQYTYTAPGLYYGDLHGRRKSFTRTQFILVQ